ncbi:MAG TPA: DUF4268 domain-containing protein [Kiritimatiellia bacterium]|nr:DUF4268 domain-containing protein [Kiritimatiellia bacterium]
MSETQLGALQIINPREVWKHEERDFTPWLANNLAEISKVIGFPIVPVEVEKRVGCFELDIYAHIDGSEKRVIIENQLEVTDHKHLGQIMTYAAGLDAVVIIWVAPIITDEHRAAIEWLNRIVREDVSFYLIRAEVIKIDYSRPAVWFYLEAGPSEFGRSLADVISNGDNPRHVFNRSFWSGLLAYFAAQGHGWAEGRKAPRESYITTSIGRGGVGAGVSMASGSRIRVEIYIYRDEEKDVFDLLFSRKETIEKMFPGDVISWERMEEAKSSRVAVYRPYDKDKINEESPERSELFKWIETRFITMQEVAKQFLLIG